MDRILIIGDAGNEWLLSVRGTDEEEGIPACSGMRRIPGGRGLCAAVALKKLGLDCILSTRIGKDAGGASILRYLNTEKIDCRFVNVTPDAGTEMHFVFDEEKETRQLIMRGAYAQLSKDDICDSFMCYPDYAVLFAGNRSFAVDAVFERAKEQKIPVFLMSASVLPKVPGNGYQCEIFSVTANEAEKLTGIPPISKEKCFRATAEMEKMIRAKAYVIRLGDRGFFYYDGTYFDFIVAYDVPIMEGSTATDGIASAAIVAQYLRTPGKIRLCCEFASIVVAYYQLNGGSIGAYPTQSDIQRFIEERELDYHDDES